MTNASINAIAKRYKYSGKEKDEESGLYYHGARYYIPWLCRWSQCDPIGIKDGLNIYVYCSNNPVMLHDPSGMNGDSDNKVYNGGEFKSVSIKVKKPEKKSQSNESKDLSMNFPRALGSLQDNLKQSKTLGKETYKSTIKDFPSIASKNRDIVLQDIHGVAIIGPQKSVEANVKKAWVKEFNEGAEAIKTTTGSVTFLITGDIEKTKKAAEFENTFVAAIIATPSMKPKSTNNAVNNKQQNASAPTTTNTPTKPKTKDDNLSFPISVKGNNNANESTKGIQDIDNFITPHAYNRHRFDPSKVSTKSKTQYEQGIDVIDILNQTINNADDIVKHFTDEGVHYATTYKKTFNGQNISTSETPTSESRVIINLLEPDKSTQFPFYKR